MKWNILNSKEKLIVHWEPLPLPYLNLELSRSNSMSSALEDARRIMYSTMSLAFLSINSTPKSSFK